VQLSSLVILLGRPYGRAECTVEIAGCSASPFLSWSQLHYMLLSLPCCDSNPSRAPRALFPALSALL
jgi:hypothetical protein